MSWEVPGMSSQTWCFNRGLARDLLRRWWLLWAAYFALLLLLFPVTLMSQVHNPYDPDLYFNAAALSCVKPGVLVTAGAVLLAVMVAFGWLYGSRSCYLMASLPVSRGALFFTLVTVSLGLCLGAVTLTALISFAIAVPSGLVQSWAVGKWLGLMLLGCLGFYGFALFCAMLTGNLIVLPLIYVLLGCAAVVVESCLRHLMSYFIFGLPVSGEKLSALSPFFRTMTGLRVSRVLDETMTAIPDRYTITDEGTLAVYALCGAALIALSLLLFRRRKMEHAGDTVAYDVLRPIFRLCMALGCAIVLPTAVFDALFNRSVFGTPAAVLLGALSCVGTFAGWYGAEMIMRKSTAVFFYGWKKLVILCAAIALFFIAGESDLFGFERRVPAAEEVQSVSFNGLTLSEPESIEHVLSLHKSILSHKSRHEHAQQASYFIFSYTLADGREIQRSYRIAITRDELLDPGSDLNALNALFQTREAIYARTLSSFPLDELILTNGFIEYEDADSGRYEAVNLSGEEADRLLREAVLPDLEANRIDRQYVFYPGVESYTRGSSVSLYFNAVSKAAPRTGGQNTLYISVQTDSLDTVAYLKEHFGIEVIANGILHPPGEYDLLYGVALDYD